MSVQVKYTRDVDVEVFEKLPHDISEIYLTRSSPENYVLTYGEGQASKMWIEIKDSYISTSLNVNHRLSTSLIDKWSVEKNILIFFIRYMQLVVSDSLLYHRDEYIFKRNEDPYFFEHFDDDVHTLYIKGLGNKNRNILVKYIKDKQGGSIGFRIDPGMIVSTDKRYPYSFTYSGSFPKFEDVARVTSNIIRCIRALNETEEITE